METLTALSDSLAATGLSVWLASQVLTAVRVSIGLSEGRRDLTPRVL